jgi:hypothetical protein
MGHWNLQIHIANDDPIVVDVDELPKPTDQFLIGTNPQRRDGKEVQYILREVNQIILPLWRVNFIQILPGEMEEEVQTFVRE